MTVTHRRARSAQLTPSRWCARRADWDWDWEWQWRGCAFGPLTVRALIENL
ncbi:hypothetical protein Q8791_01435 [Nocardiopsis sp. CT-R113]|uniref:Uncharacterized protein n=1 Tax=Nocardiopsis codii TaxID=3065942 RepID=A0ABU7K0U6_9ACTN|nr:hypothetical protein [Nocardiopsis sp. CT-R113]MEE2035885.1 hypothetical protein [Nocardiopsis sp. CT-R113]